MFTNFATIFTLAVAAVSVTAQGTHTAKCNTGSLQCCNEIKQVGNYDAGAIASLLKVDAKQITGQLGVGCNPVTVIGKGSSSACTVTPVCCDSVHQKTLIGVNCTPAAASA